MTTDAKENAFNDDRAAAATESSPNLPALSKDAWELIQYRLWNQLRSKMWTTLTVFLTLVTIGGIVGIPAYISGRIDQKVADEKAKFEQLRSDLEIERLEIVTRSTLTSHLALIWAQDLAKFQLLLLRTSSAIGDQDDIRNVRNVLRLLLGKLGRFDVDADEFRYEVRMLTDILKRGELPVTTPVYSDAPLTQDEWASFRGAAGNRNLAGLLPELYELYSHLVALRSAMLQSYELMVDPTLTQPLRRAKLYGQYNGSVYPNYQKSLAALYGTNRPAWIRGGRDWEWLPETALSAFISQEQRLNQKDDGQAKK